MLIHFADTSFFQEMNTAATLTLAIKAKFANFQRKVFKKFESVPRGFGCLSPINALQDIESLCRQPVKSHMPSLTMGLLLLLPTCGYCQDVW